MKSVLLDTHAWVWSFADDTLLSERARRIIGGADVVYVSPISFFEIGQKVRSGRWPEMAAHVDDLTAILDAQGGLAAPFTAGICVRASLMDWDHRDPFDRLIVATAEVMGVPLVSKDLQISERLGASVIW